MLNVKKTVAAVTVSTLLATGAFAGSHALSGDLVIFSDMSDPAPRAVMEGMVDRFGALHPNLNIELTVINREAMKTQILNFTSANAPDLTNW